MTLRLSVLCFLLALAPLARSQAPGTVLSHQKISDTQGGFAGPLSRYDHFGASVALLGDLDGDGVADLAVGADGDADSGGFTTKRGAVWVLFLKADGTVKSSRKISGTQGGFTGTLDDWDLFGSSVAALGDLDGDGVTDLAVGAYGDDDGGLERGAVWVLFLNADGTVKSHQKISATQGGFTGTLVYQERLGWSLASTGDLDGDGVADLAAGTPGDGDGGRARGAVWMLFLNADGTVKAHQKISDTQGGFTGTLDDIDFFGASVAALDDLDGDGVKELAVGAYGDDDGPAEGGAVWVLFLNTDGTVKAHQKISATQGGFTGTLDEGDLFGSTLGALGDLDGDGVVDLAVGAPWDDDGGVAPVARGAVWVLILRNDGTVKWHQKISSTQGGFTGALDDGDLFGKGLASVGDLDGDGVVDLAAGASHDDDGDQEKGAVWVLFLGQGVQASTTVRNGTGVNGLCFASLNEPILGTTWQALVLTSSHPGATLTAVVLHDQPATGPVLSGGEVLVGGTKLGTSWAVPGGGVAAHAIPVPNDPSLAGRSGYSQAVVLGGGWKACNAIDVVVGY